MPQVTSRDGTRIAYDILGSGPTVVLVDGAFGNRGFGPMTALAERLAARFRVVHCDRRSRGESGMSTDYRMEREFEDLEALIAVAGGPVHLFGTSSGAALALRAVAAGVPVASLALHEPPYMVGPKARQIPADHRQVIETMVAEGRNGDVVKYFMVTLLGMPSIFTIPMRLSKMWKPICAAAPSLPYDMAALDGFGFPADAARRIAVPTLCLSGTKTFPSLKDAMALTARTIPGARHIVMEGQSHEVKTDAIAPHLEAFFAAHAMKAAA